MLLSRCLFCLSCLLHNTRLDLDGDLDIVSGTKDTGFFFYENTGSAYEPSFVARTGLENPFANVVSDAENPRYTDYGRHVLNPTFADLDGDGDKDLVVAANGGGICKYKATRLWYFENKKNDEATAYQQASAAAFNVLQNDDSTLDKKRHSASGLEVGAAFADLDGDGDVDLLLPPYFHGNLERKGYCWEHSIHLENGQKKPAYIEACSPRYYENTGAPGRPVFERRFGVANPFYGLGGPITQRTGRVQGGAVYGNKENENCFSFADLNDDGLSDLIAASESRGHPSESGYEEISSTKQIRYFENVGTSTSPAFEERIGANINPFHDFEGIHVGSDCPRLFDIDGPFR